VDISDLARVNEAFFGFDHARDGPLLHADLDDPFGFPDCLDDLQPLFWQRSHWFLDVDIFSGLTCVDGDLGVNVIESPNHYSVDVFSIQ
jgi:hypothetical protein